MSENIYNLFDLSYDEMNMKECPGPEWNDIDSKLLISFDNYLKYSDNDRELIINSLNYKNFDDLSFFAYRFSIFGLRNEDIDFLKKSILSLSIIDYDNYDFREVYIILKMVVFFSLRIEASTEDIFNIATIYGNQKNKKLFLNFPDKFSSEYLLKNGIPELKEFKTDNGLIFLNYNDYGIDSFNYHNPSVPFWKILCGIKNFLSREGYGFGNYSLSSFSANYMINLTDRAINYLKNYFLACGQVLVYSKYDDSQIIEVKIYELINSHKSSLLEKLISIKRDRESGYLNLIRCFSSERYVIILIVSNYGKREFIETHESLERFIEPIKEILKKKATASN